jgi:hypothetical protein
LLFVLFFRLSRNFTASCCSIIPCVRLCSFSRLCFVSFSFSLVYLGSYLVFCFSIFLVVRHVFSSFHETPRPLIV